MNEENFSQDITSFLYDWFVNTIRATKDQYTFKLTYKEFRKELTKYEDLKDSTSAVQKVLVCFRALRTHQYFAKLSFQERCRISYC